MPEPPDAPDLFLFLDYRAYLRAHYEHRKTRPGGYSFRAFSRRAGLRSPNYLKLVIDGERNLTAAMAERFAGACGLDAEGLRYFADLVAFNQARTVEARNRAYARLQRQRRYQEGHRLSLAQDVYHSRWYLPAIRELVLSRQFRDDPDWIAAHLTPPIRPREAATAVQTLLELGLLERDAEGRLRQREATVTTGPEVRSLHLANFHRNMIDQAKSSLDRIPAKRRDISSLTLCLSEEGLERAKRAIQRFRKELLELAELERAPGDVVQINFQLFPLTTVTTGTGSERDGDGT
ncbi:MAG: TIGR02147 family protein [Myxococcales bacterium]|nr:TIGR02147 family protein [Myxococcales bacterium]